MNQQDQEAITHLLEHEAVRLTTWEIDFLGSIDGRASLTSKQKQKFEDIWRDVVNERNRDR